MCLVLSMLSAEQTKRGGGVVRWWGEVYKSQLRTRIPVALYSRIPLSRAPLTRENQLVALAPWTPNFSDAPLATARMTDR